MLYRYYFILNKQQLDLDFNIIEFSRYAEQTQCDIKHIKQMLHKIVRQRALRNLRLYDNWDLIGALSKFYSSSVYSPLTLTKEDCLPRCSFAIY